MKIFSQDVRLLAASAVFAALTLTGCSHDDAETPPAPSTTTVVTTPPAATSTTTTPGAPGTMAATPPTNNTNAGPGGATGTDADTSDAINKTIHTNTQMTGSRITAVVTGGVARLTGTAQNAQQRALAESTARQQTGVTSVVDKIEIAPTGGVKATPPKTLIKTITKTKVIYKTAPTPPADTSTTTTTDGSTGTSPADNAATTNSDSTATP